MHYRRAHWRSIVARPLHTADPVKKFEGHTLESWCELRDFIHNLGFFRVVHRVTECPGEVLRDLPLGHALARLHYGSNPVDTALGIDEGTVLFEERRSGQENMCKFGRLV